MYVERSNTPGSQERLMKTSQATENKEECPQQGMEAIHLGAIAQISVAAPTVAQLFSGGFVANVLGFHQETACNKDFLYLDCAQH